MDLEEAISEAVQKGKKYAYAQAAAAGARDIEVFVNREDHCGTLRRLCNNDGKNGLGYRLFIESVIDISAVGRPWN